MIDPVTRFSLLVLLLLATACVVAAAWPESRRMTDDSRVDAGWLVVAMGDGAGVAVAPDDDEAIGEEIEACADKLGCLLPPLYVLQRLRSAGLRGRRLLLRASANGLCEIQIETMRGKTCLALGAPMDLNAVGVTELKLLPGVGERLATRIVKFRDDRGRFSNVEELKDVRGVGTRKLSSLLPYIAVFTASGRLSSVAP